MIDVYQLNVILLLAVAFEAISAYAGVWSAGTWKPELLFKELRRHGLYGLGTFLGFSPTFVARQIVFGNPLSVGPYALNGWNWTSPVFLQVLFNASHGLLVFTPIVVLAFAGLFYLRSLDKALGTLCVFITLVFYYFVSSFPWWYGAVGFGNRFFVSLTPIFILGLASLFARAARLWPDSRSASLRIIPITLLFVFWNLGLVYQWQTHLMPRYGAVYWQELVFNQFRVVPVQALHDLGQKFCVLGPPHN